MEKKMLLLFKEFDLNLSVHGIQKLALTLKEKNLL